MENAQRLITAVDILRREVAAAPAEPADVAAEAALSFARADRALRTALAELDKLRAMPLDAEGRTQLQGVIDQTTGTLKLIGLEVNV